MHWRIAHGMQDMHAVLRQRHVEFPRSTSQPGDKDLTRPTCLVISCACIRQKNIRAMAGPTLFSDFFVSPAVHSPLAYC